MHSPSSALETAKRFLAARKEASGLPEYPGTAPVTLDDGYTVQSVALDLATEPVTGWKVGRILPPKTEQYGSNWLAGPIFASTVQPADGETPGLVFAEGFGAVEAEFLFRIGSPPPAGQMHFSLEEAAALISAVHIGIEIASSPFPGINTLGPAVTISDFGNNNGLLVGPEVPDWRSGGYARQEVVTRIDGEEIGRGVAASFVDGALGSVRFLIENLVARSIDIRPGWWISTGAVTGVHPVRPGQMAETDFGPYGVLRCQIEAQLPR